MAGRGWAAEPPAPPTVGAQGPEPPHPRRGKALALSLWEAPPSGHSGPSPRPCVPTGKPSFPPTLESASVTRPQHEVLCSSQPFFTL